jgi:hypothetical protein
MTFPAAAAGYWIDPKRVSIVPVICAFGKTRSTFWPGCFSGRDAPGDH